MIVVLQYVIHSMVTALLEYLNLSAVFLWADVELILFLTILLKVRNVK